MTSITENAQTAADVVITETTAAPATTETTAAPATAETTAAPAATETVVDPNAPKVGDCYPFYPNRAIKGKDGKPFLLKGGLFGNYAGALHVSELNCKTRELRDARMLALSGSKDPIFVEVIEVGGETRLSEKLAAQRLEFERLMKEPKVSAVVFEDAKPDSEWVHVVIGDGHRARLHARDLKESSREARDARIKTLKKDTVLDVTLTGFRRHPEFTRFNVDVQEVGRQEKKAKQEDTGFARRKGPAGPSPLGNKTGDRAKAEAKRAERRMRDQAERNKAKGSGGGKK